MLSPRIRLPGAVGLVLLATMSARAMAQPNTPAVPSQPATTVDGLYIFANKGQTPTQQAQDRYDCHTWATGQTGFDPSRPGGGVPTDQNIRRRAGYQRAMTACLEARGYTVRYAAAPPMAAPPVVAPPYEPEQYGPSAGAPGPAQTSSPLLPMLEYHPVEVQIDGGYSVAAGNTGQSLYGGPNIGLGVSWFPSPSLPLGIRVDASDSGFGLKRQWVSSTEFGSGNEQIYGGDADLQLNLDRSQHARFYLLGGVGEYREHLHLRDVSLASGSCSSFEYFCGPYVSGVMFEHGTTDWHFAWNAGAGWEVAISPSSSFFAEARYLHISFPSSSALQFVPIRVGLRF